MAFSKHRFRDMSGGQSGFGYFGVYDGRGTGGDNRAAIIGAGFMNSEEVKDAIRRGLEAIPFPANNNRANGRLYPILVLATDGFSWEPFFVNETVGQTGQVQHDGTTAFAIT